MIADTIEAIGGVLIVIFLIESATGALSDVISSWKTTKIVRLKKCPDCKSVSEDRVRPRWKEVEEEDE